MKEFDIDILPPGTHTDAFGSTENISAEFNRKLAETYNTSVHKAPVILGHSSDPEFMAGELPSDSIPAYGWIKKAYVDSTGTLRAIVELSDQAVQWIKDRFYDFRSVGLYGPGSPYTPVEGQPYIRHLALLGAMPPAIKGMEPLSSIVYSEGKNKFSVTYCDDTMKKITYVEQVEEDVLEDQLEENTLMGEDYANVPSPEEVEGFFSDEEEEPMAMAEEEEVGVEPELEPEPEGEGDDDVISDAEAEEVADYLNANASEFLEFLLTQGDSGYAGEITRFEPVPSQDNTWLMNPETGNFEGVFVDESLGEPESFEFSAKKQGEDWIVSYKPLGSEEEGIEAGVDEPEPVEEEVSPEGEEEEMAMGEKGKKLTAMAEKARNARLYSENLKLKQRLNRIENEKIREEILSVYSEGKLTEGQFPSKDLITLAQSLKGSNVVSFSEGKATPLVALKKLLKALPVQVVYGEQIVKGEAEQVNGNIEAPIGSIFDESGLKTHQKIQAYAEEHGIDLRAPGKYQKVASIVAN